MSVIDMFVLNIRNSVYILTLFYTRNPFSFVCDCIDFLILVVRSVNFIDLNYTIIPFHKSFVTVSRYRPCSVHKTFRLTMSPVCVR